MQASIWRFSNESAPLSLRHPMKVHVIVGYILEFFAAAHRTLRLSIRGQRSHLQTPSFPASFYFLVSLQFDAITKMIPAEFDLVRNCDDGRELHVNTGVERTRKADVTVSNSLIKSIFITLACSTKSSFHFQSSYLSRII